LARLRFQVATGAAAEGLRIVPAGLHPFSRWEGHRRTEDVRYQELERAFGRIARDVHTFGMHVHVALPEEVDRVVVQNAVRPWLPHLLALSASSPYFEGEDTGFDSFRTLLSRRWPNAGVPPRFANAAEFWRLTDMLVEGGVVRDKHTLYWSMRVHPVYPTVEIRVMDACPGLDDAVTVASLCRAVVAAAAEDALPPAPGTQLSGALEHELLRVNEWSAARNGLDATLLGFGDAPEPLRASLDRLVEAVAPVATELGHAQLADEVARIVTLGNPAARMRAAADGAGLSALVGWLVGEGSLGTGLDRRGGQRGTPGARS
ncbi:MAG: YbdK family carboxylate-amine ligase, partial [Gemmatimonadota bacterium]